MAGWRDALLAGEELAESIGYSRNSGCGNRQQHPSLSCRRGLFSSLYVDRKEMEERFLCARCHVFAVRQLMVRMAKGGIKTGWMF